MNEIRFQLRPRKKEDELEAAPQRGKRPRVAEVLALAISFDDMIRRGIAKDYTDLARLGCISKERVSQITHLTFAIADGATDFVAGDAFTITVAAGSGRVKQIDFAAIDGSDIACGILTDDTTAPDGTDRSAVAVVRNAIVSDNGITWPAGATTNQKNAAIAQMKSLGILVRQGA